jgi:hypothetical protein
MAHILSSKRRCISSRSSNHFYTSTREFKAATIIPGQKNTVISRLKEAGLRPRHAALKTALKNVNYEFTASHLLTELWLASGIDLHCLTYLRFALHMMAWF